MTNGAPAFPLFGHSTADQEWFSLRDWFAGQALIGLIACPDITLGSDRNYARAAYEYADAMLTARVEKQP